MQFRWSFRRPNIWLTQKFVDPTTTRTTKSTQRVVGGCTFKAKAEKIVVACLVLIASFKRLDPAGKRSERTRKRDDRFDSDPVQGMLI